MARPDTPISYPFLPVAGDCSIDFTSAGPWTITLSLDSGQPFFWPADGTVFVQGTDDQAGFWAWGTVASFDGTSVLSINKKYVPSGIASTTITSVYVTLIDGAPQPSAQYSMVGLTAGVSTGDVSHDITVQPGNVMDSTGTINLSLSSALTKQIDAAFTEGTNQGGMVTSAAQTGTVTASASSTITGTGTSFTQVFGTGVPPATNAEFAQQCALYPNPDVFIPGSYPSVITIGGTAYKVTSVTNDTTLIVNTSVTATDAAFSVGGNASGANGVYYLIVIARKDSTGVCDICFTPPTGPNGIKLPTGYTFYRIIGLFITNTGAIARSTYGFIVQPMRPYVAGGNPCGRIVASNVDLNITVSNSGTIYYKQFNGESIPVFDGNRWVPYLQSSILSNIMVDASPNPDTTVPCGLYNLYIWRNSSGSLVFSRGPLLTRTSATVTMTIASPGVITYTAHGLQPGTPVIFTTTGALPTGITAGTVYYVIATGIAANTFRISATRNGAAVNTSGTQSGVHTCTVGWTGTPTVELAKWNGYSSSYYSNLNDITNGPVASFGLYVGTIATNANGNVDWIFGGIAAGGTEAFFGVWNYYNRVNIGAFVSDSANTWTPGSTRRPVNNAYNMRVSFVCGIPEDNLTAEYSVPGQCSVAGVAQVSIGVDLTTGAPTTGISGILSDATAVSSIYQLAAKYSAIPTSGFHFVQAQEVAATGTWVFLGDNAGAYPLSGLTFNWRA